MDIINFTISNQTLLAKFSWFNAFLLNGPLISYTLVINNQTLSETMNTFSIVSFKIDKCEHQSFLKEDKISVNGFIFMINIQIIATTIYSFEKSSTKKIPYNCSGKKIFIAW